MTGEEAQGHHRILDELGLNTEAVGPLAEWSPVPPGPFQRRHAAFWGMVDRMYHDEDGPVENIPDWMSEAATEQLLNNSI